MFNKCCFYSKKDGAASESSSSREGIVRIISHPCDQTIPLTLINHFWRLIITVLVEECMDGSSFQGQSQFFSSSGYQVLESSKSVLNSFQIYPYSLKHTWLLLAITNLTCHFYVCGYCSYTIYILNIYPNIFLHGYIPVWGGYD